MARAKLLLQESEAYAQNIGDTIRDPLIILDRDLRVKSANRSFYKTFQTLPEETEGRPIGDLGTRQWNITETRQGEEFLGCSGLRRLVKGAHNGAQNRVLTDARSPDTLEQTAQAILTGARAFAGGSFRDDICIVLARRQ